MKTSIQIISLLFALLITPMTGSAISIYENPQPCIDELLFTPNGELDNAQLENYKQVSIVVSNDQKNGTATTVTYVNFLIGNSISNNEFYLKRVVTVNENKQMRLVIYKVKFGNFLLKIIVNNWRVYRILCDDI